MFVVMEHGVKRDLPSLATLVKAAMPMETMDTTIKRTILMGVEEVILTRSRLLTSVGLMF
jgi:hypothetical protein